MPTQTELETTLRTELSDLGTFWSNTELDRAVAKAESLLSRAIPKKAVKEITITHEVASATFVVASSTGTTTYHPIEPESEVLKNAAGTTMVRDTNYTIDYLTGVITEVGALLPDAVNYTISYHKDPQKIDLGSLLTNPLKVTRIEYPVGDKPPTYLANWDIIDGMINLGKDTSLATGEHLRIFYDAMWTAATESVAGDYPTNLADVLLIGAAGQALLIKAEKYVQQAVTECGLVNTAADSMSTPLGDINIALDKVATNITLAGTALDKVTTYMATNGTSDNAAEVLANVTDDAAELRTAIETALDKAATYLTSTSTEPAAHKYLTDGDAYITTVNVADQVAQKYSDYARAAVQIYNGLIAEATVRLENIKSYVAESDEWVKIANGFVEEATQRIAAANAFNTEASQRIAEVQAWGIQADKYTTTTREYLNIAGRYLASGQAKLNEFYTMLGVKAEIQQVRTSGVQNPNY